MKTIVITLRLFTILTFSLITTSIVNAQEKSVLQSQAEEFSVRDGTLIQQEYFPLGTFKESIFEIAKYTDLLDGSHISALRITMKVKGKYTSDTKIASLDKDEVNSLLASFQKIESEIVSTVPTVYTEVKYIARDGFQAGCYWSKSKWTFFLKLEKFDNDSYIWFKVAELQPLIDLLIQANAKLSP